MSGGVSSSSGTRGDSGKVSSGGIGKSGKVVSALVYNASRTKFSHTDLLFSK